MSNIINVAGLGAWLYFTLFFLQRASNTLNVFLGGACVMLLMMTVIELWNTNRQRDLGEEEDEDE